MHGLNGVGPEIANLQFITYVIPVLLYGLETLVLTKPEMETLVKYHKKCLKCIQHLPQSTADPACYLLLGVLPVPAQLDIKTLTLVRNILANEANTHPGAFIREVIIRQAAAKSYESSSWVTHVKRTLREYQLPTIYDLIESTPTKASWKHRVERAVHAHWTEKLQDAAQEYSSLEFLNLSLCSTSQLHPVWQDLESPLDIRRATVQAKLLTKRYPLATSHTAGKRKVETCPLCKEEDETTSHFILYCPQLHNTRIQYLQKVLSHCRDCDLSVEPEALLRYILDTNNMSDDPDYRSLCRNFLYKMHDERTKRLGGGSGYLARHM